MRVLIVAADRELAGAVTDALSPLSLEVVLVHSAEAAMESALEQMPELVLADFSLPGRNGMDLLAELGIEQGKSPQRVLITGEEPLPRRWGLDIPVLARPFRTSTLQWLVQSLLAPGAAGSRTAPLAARAN